MNTEENKRIMAENIKRQMERKGVTKQQVCDALDFKYTTFVDWLNAKTYPRIGKVEAMANYFGCVKSDLIEEKTEEHREMQKKNDDLATIVVRLRTDDNFLSVVKAINEMDDEKLSSLLGFLK